MKNESFLFVFANLVSLESEIEKMFDWLKVNKNLKFLVTTRNRNLAQIKETETNYNQFDDSKRIEIDYFNTNEIEAYLGKVFREQFRIEAESIKSIV